MADRSIEALISAAFRAVVYVVVIVVAIRYNRRPELDGKLSPFVVALFHGLAFSVLYEVYARWHFPDIDVNYYRVWSAAITVHMIGGIYISLRKIKYFIAELLATIETLSLAVAICSEHNVSPATTTTTTPPTDERGRDGS